MNRTPFRPGVILFAAGLLLTSALLVGVQAVAVHALPLLSPTVVGTVDLEATFNGLEEWSQVQVSLTQRADQMQEEITRRQDELESLETDLEDYPQGSAKFKEAMKRYQMAAIELQGYVQFQQRKHQRFNDQTIFALYDKIKLAARTLADEQGYDIILVDDSVVEIPENSENILAQISSRRVLFAREQMNVTDQLIESMNTMYQKSTAAN
ncbi:MAG: OmpH family outer membrane protein [Phycisphaerales bacterium]|nr:OmpH family outer membrane protein [Phycisphaerales bacterium]